MKPLTAAAVNADISMLMDGCTQEKRVIPSAGSSFRTSFSIPFLSLVLSFISLTVVYCANTDDKSMRDFIGYCMSDGLVIIAPAVLAGLLFAFMTYNNLMIYMTLPDNIREKSIVLSHLKSVVRRVVLFFLFLMVGSVILSGFSGWFAIAVPGLEFALLFIVNIAVSMEINRLCSGLAVEKINALMKQLSNKN